MAHVFGFGEKIAVINDELLNKAVTEQAPEAQKAYGQDVDASEKDIVMLRLDLSKILKIDNLWAFTNLRKLQLDNNLIETIENLDSLVHLEWLDLSYNQIERIEGLDKLTKLKDLSLHSNKIQRLEGLDQLKHLEVLSVGQNNLASLDDAPVLYLRRFRKLSCLNLAENPLCDDPRYESYCIAMLPQLVFLDYRRVAAETRQSARIKYQDQLEVAEKADADQILAEEREEEAAAQRARLAKACVPGLSGSAFFSRMVDKDFASLREVEGMDELFETLEARLVTAIDTLVEFAVSESERRNDEEAEFREALQDGIEAINDRDARRLEEFIERKAEIISALAASGSAVDMERAEVLRDDLGALKHQLMDAEIDLVGQIEDMLGNFERAYVEMCSKVTEQAQSTFTEVRQLIEEIETQVGDVANGHIDAIIKGEMELNALQLSPQAQEVLRDKLALGSAMTTAHDNHIGEVDSTEDAILAAVTEARTKLLEDIQTNMDKRHRARVAEIMRFHKDHLTDIERVLNDI